MTLLLALLIVGCLRAQLPDVLHRIPVGLAIAQPYGERGRSNRAAVGQLEECATFENLRDLLASELGRFELRCHGVNSFAKGVESKCLQNETYPTFDAMQARKTLENKGFSRCLDGCEIFPRGAPIMAQIIALTGPENRLWRLLGKSSAMAGEMTYD